jgi:hypothetical protein
MEMTGETSETRPPLTKGKIDVTQVFHFKLKPTNNILSFQLHLKHPQPQKLL